MRTHLLGEAAAKREDFATDCLRLLFALLRVSNVLYQPVVGLGVQGAGCRVQDAGRRV